MRRTTFLAVVFLGCSGSAGGGGGGGATAQSSASTGAGGAPCDVDADCHGPRERCAHADHLCGAGVKGACVACGPCTEGGCPHLAIQCGCDGRFFDPSTYLPEDYCGDVAEVSHCDGDTFACGDRTCRRLAEYCELAAPVPGGPPAPTCFPASVLGQCVGCPGVHAACVGGSVDGPVCDCPYPATPKASCHASGACLLGVPQLWDPGTACSRCGHAGTCDGAGRCDVGAPSCGPAAQCWEDTCGTVTAMGAGEHHTCAVTSFGAAFCWGLDDFGQLGDGAAAPSPFPVRVVGSGYKSISGGVAHTCAVTTTGSVACWGDNQHGQLGVSGPVASSVPLAVPGLSNVVAISAGRFHSCALTASGDVFCWGDNSDDQLGTTASTIGPNQVAGLGAGVSAVAAGGAHTCALVAGGGVMCWGRSYEGELGNGQVMTPGTAVPTSPVGLTSGVVAVTAGAAQSCAATSQGAVRCWGASPFGGVSAVPAAVAGLSNVVAVSAEDDLVCALAANGDASCFGRWADSYTHLVTSPAAISGLGSSTTSLVTGGHHACFLSAGGTMKCWGANDHGQLGTGNLTSSESAAVDVLPP